MIHGIPPEDGGISRAVDCAPLALYDPYVIGLLRAAPEADDRRPFGALFPGRAKEVYIPGPVDTVLMKNPTARSEDPVCPQVDKSLADSGGLNTLSLPFGSPVYKTKCPVHRHFRVAGPEM